MATFSAAIHSEGQHGVCRLEAIGGGGATVDFEPLCSAARMLYGSSFIAERTAGIADFLRGGSTSSKQEQTWVGRVKDDTRLLPVTRSILATAGVCAAADDHRAWQSLYECG
jgi:hypothetical protein